MIKYALIIAALLFGFAAITQAAPTTTFFRTILPETTDTYDLGSATKVWNNLYVNTITTSAGTAVSGSGVSGRAAFWDGTNSLSSDSTFLFDSALDKLTVTNASTTNLTVGTAAYFPSGIWNSSGNVGIGTTTPAALFSVAGAGYFTGNLGVGIAAPSFPLHVIGNGRFQNTGAAEYLDVMTTDANNAYLRFVTGNNSRFVVGVDAADSSKFKIGTANDFTTTRLTIDTTGNVGVGRTGPIFKLDVSGPQRLWDGTNTGVMVGGSLASGSVSSNQINGINAAGNVYGDLVLNANSGNVGIGTTSPEGKLHVYTATAGSVTASANGDDLIIENSGTTGLSFLSPNTATQYILFGDTDDNDIGDIRYNHTDNSLRLTTNAGGGFIHLTSAGNVGIGTTTPDTTLNVVKGAGKTWTTTAGTVAVFERANSTSAAAYVSVISGNTGTARLQLGDTDSEARGLVNYDNSTDALSLWTAGSQKLTILTGGNVGIGTTTPSAKLGIGGTGTLFELLDTAGSMVMRVVSSTVTLLGTWDFSGATVKTHEYSSFTYATSTAWTATTTIPLGPAATAESWDDVMCFTDTGTLNVSIYDGTNRMNMFNASTTVGTVDLSTNNTFTVAEKRYVDVGTPASTPTKISCTVDRIVNN